MIDVLVPVLGRPQNVRPLLQSLHAATTVPHKVLFLTTPSDVAEILACREAGGPMLEVDGEHHQYGRKMNRGFRATSSPFVLMASDDIDFQPGWDREALAVAEQTGAGVIGTDDLANPNVRKGKFSTHPLVRRSYVEEQGASLDGPGVLCHEGYDHNYVDVEIAELAQARGQWAFAPQSKIKHMHPGFGGAEQDATYAKGFRQFKRDQQLFLKRRRQFK